MDKVRFQGIIDLYASDYEFMQDSIEKGFVDLIQQLLSTPTLPCILRGFTLQINSLDNTRFDVIQDDGFGSVITSIPTVVISTTNNMGIAPASTSTNRVYAHYTPTQMSYNRSTGELDTSPRCFNFSTGTLVHNRLIDTYEIVTMTLSQYNSLSDDEKTYYVYLGSLTITSGTGVITAVDIVTDVARVQFNVPDGSIVSNHLSPSIQIPQAYTDTSATISDTYDWTASPPNTLQDDLNKIRTILKQIKNTSTYDTYVSGVEGYIPEQASRYLPGLFSDFTYTIINGGTQIQVSTGGGLWDNKIKKTSSTITFTIPTFSTVTVGNHSLHQNGETHTFYSPSQTVSLNHAPIQMGTLYGHQDGMNPLVEDAEGDFTVNYTTGVVTTTSTSNLGYGEAGVSPGETGTFFYTYGQYRYDYILLTTNGLSYEIGTPSDSAYPTLPYVSPTNGIIVLYIYRPALQNTVTAANLISPKFNIPSFKYSVDIPITLANNVSYYNGSTFTVYREWGVNQVCLTNSSNVPVASGTGWSIGTVHNIANLLTISNKTTILQTIINTQADDELWVSVILPDDPNDLTLELSFASNTAAPNTFDTTVNTSVPISSTNNPNTLVPIRLYKGFTKGLHKVRIKIASGSNASTAVIEKLVVGKLDLNYDRTGKVIKGDLTIEGDLNVLGQTTSNTQQALVMSANHLLFRDGETNNTSLPKSGMWIRNGLTADDEAGYYRIGASDTSLLEMKAPTGDGIFTVNADTNFTLASDSATGARTLYVDPGTSRINQDVRDTALPTFYGAYYIRTGTSPFAFVGSASATGGGILYTQATGSVESEPIGRTVFYRRTSGTNYSVMSFSPTSSVAFFRGALKLNKSTSDTTDPIEAIHIIRSTTEPAIRLEKSDTNAGAGTIRFNSADKSILFITE